MEPAKINYKIYQGSTFRETLRWESETQKYAQISNISKSGPCVITTAAAHDIPLNWRVRVTGVSGMKEINLTDDTAYYLVTDKTATTVTLQQVNSSNYTAYTSGGVVSWNMPIPIDIYTAKMQIRETIESPDVIAELTTSNGGIIFDTVNYSITLNISSSITRNFNFESAIYGLNLITITNQNIPFIRGSMSLVQEVVR